MCLQNTRYLESSLCWLFLFLGHLSFNSTCAAFCCVFFMAALQRVFKEMVIIHRGQEKMVLYFFDSLKALPLSIRSPYSHTLFGVLCFLIVVDVGALPENDLCAQPVGLLEWNLVLGQMGESAEDTVFYRQGKEGINISLSSIYAGERTKNTGCFKWHVHAKTIQFLGNEQVRQDS